MLLTTERDTWKAQYEAGEPCPALVLQEYREKRNSNLWRMSRQVEMLCEYILYLEGGCTENNHKSKELQRVVAVLGSKQYPSTKLPLNTAE